MHRNILELKSILIAPEKVQTLAEAKDVVELNGFDLKDEYFSVVIWRRSGKETGKETGKDNCPLVLPDAHVIHLIEVMGERRLCRRHRRRPLAQGPVRR